MDKNLLRAYMAEHGDTQAQLAEAMGISLSRLNAKINGTRGAEFSQSEIQFIANRYQMKAKEVSAVFFAGKVS